MAEDDPMVADARARDGAEPGPPADLACVRCGDTARVRAIRSEISGAWWVLCQLQACRAIGSTDGRVLTVRLAPLPAGEREPGAEG